MKRSLFYNIPISYIVIFFCFLILLIRICSVYLTNISYHNGQSVILHARLLKDVKHFDNSDKIDFILPRTFPPQRVHIYLPLFSEIQYGDYISVSGTLKQSVSGREEYNIYLPTVEILSTWDDSLFNLLSSLRERITNQFLTNLPRREAGLLLGIVFGVNTYITRDTADLFGAIGITHIVAASGMNVSIIAAIIFGLFQKIFNRKNTIIITLFLVCFYALFAGGEPSIIRASIMGSLTFIASFLGRQYSSYYSLFLTACLMLLFWPDLVFNLGFQLSVFATWGILVIRPLFPLRGVLIDEFFTTLAAQIATIPIIFYYFGSYNLLSLLANILILSLIPYIMILGLIGAIGGLLIPQFSQILLLLLPVFWYIEQIINLLTRQKYIIEIHNIALILIFFYYICLHVVIYIIGKRKERLL